MSPGAHALPEQQVLPWEGSAEPGSPGEGRAHALGTGSDPGGPAPPPTPRISCLLDAGHHSPSACTLTQCSCCLSQPAGDPVTPGDGHTVICVSPPETHSGPAGTAWRQLRHHSTEWGVPYLARTASTARDLMCSCWHQAGTRRALPDGTSRPGAGRHPLPALSFPPHPRFTPETLPGQGSPKLFFLLVTPSLGLAARHHRCGDRQGDSRHHGRGRCRTRPDRRRGHSHF